jgi:hypothetical protein
MGLSPVEAGRRAEEEYATYRERYLRFFGRIP